MSDLGDFTSFDGDEGDAGGGDDPADADAGDTTDAEESFERVEVTPPGSDHGLGVLSASEGLTISEDPDDTRLRAYVTVANRSRVRIGTYLLVPYPDGERLFCRITALEYAQEFHTDDATEIHARRAMRSGGIDEQDFKFVAELEPVAVLYEEHAAAGAGSGEGGADPELKRRMTDRVPKPETVVRAATDTDEIKTGLKIPAEGVFLGHLAVGGERVTTGAEPPTIDYRLQDDYGAGDPLVFRHTLVAGGTGSGKTHAAKNVLRQYLDADRTYPVEAGSDREVRAAVVQFDPQDEYAQMHDDN
ncbi:MAG: helicase HerA domain-containing protein, partial [Halorientalis sp.]